MHRNKYETLKFTLLMGWIYNQELSFLAISPVVLFKVASCDCKESELAMFESGLCSHQLNYMWLVNKALFASVSPENEMCVIIM